jgi:SCP-2 sterol transfer family protein
LATQDEVESTLSELIGRFEDLDPAYRVLLPSRRTVEVTFPDLGATYHAQWRDGALSELTDGPAQAPHVRIECDSDDLIAMARKELTFRRAFMTNRVRVEASMTDLLRLRGVL